MTRVGFSWNRCVATNIHLDQSSSTYPDPTLASLLPRKTRSLCDIYNDDTTNSFSVFSLFSQIDDPLTFEEVFKDDVWAQAMDEEIRCIENNQK
jgi:hypothetical protein